MPKASLGKGLGGGCQGPAVPEGAGQSHVSQHGVPVLVSPFPSPPTAPSCPHLQILLGQSHPAERELLSGMGASWGLQAENALALLPALPATLRKGKPSARCVDSNSCAMEKEGNPISEPCCALGPPCPAAPRGMQVLTGLTCASQACPALRARWGGSAAAPPGFLHLQEGSGATGDQHEGFPWAFPPPSALLS